MSSSPEPDVEEDLKVPVLEDASPNVAYALKEITNLNDPVPTTLLQIRRAKRALDREDTGDKLGHQEKRARHLEQVEELEAKVRARLDKSKQPEWARAMERRMMDEIRETHRLQELKRQQQDAQTINFRRSSLSESATWTAVPNSKGDYLRGAQLTSNQLLQELVKPRLKEWLQFYELDEVEAGSAPQALFANKETLSRFLRGF